MPSQCLYKFVYSRYWVGQSINMIANITLKTMASTPRPHFIDTCNPDWTQVDCDSNDGSVRDIIMQKFVELTYLRNVVFDLSCCHTAIEAGSSLLRVNDSMKSFPSGHSQLALFAA